jgi:hypothetical protein
MPKSRPPEDNPDLSEVLPPTSEPSNSNVAQDTLELSDAAQAAVEEAMALRARLQQEALDATVVWSRSSEKQRDEDDQQHQDRIKREFEAAVMATRRQESAPPPPPQPVPPAISRQTEREMAAGAKQSAYWAEQQKQRPLPNARDIQAAGMNTPVFRPGEFMHEKGDSEGKNKSTTQLPSR